MGSIKIPAADRNALSDTFFSCFICAHAHNSSSRGNVNYPFTTVMLIYCLETFFLYIVQIESIYLKGRIPIVIPIKGTFFFDKQSFNAAFKIFEIFVVVRDNGNYQNGIFIENCEYIRHNSTTGKD